MREDIVKRVFELAEYVSRTGATVRETAKVFDMTKSTVHAYLTKRLRALDADLFAKVARRLGYNLSVRHLRGGEATRQKYKAKLYAKSVL